MQKRRVSRQQRARSLISVLLFLFLFGFNPNPYSDRFSIKNYLPSQDQVGSNDFLEVFPLSSNGGSPEINDTYSGNGTSLEYNAAIEGSESLNEYNKLEAPFNTTTLGIPLVENAQVTTLNLSLGSLEKLDSFLTVINNTVLLSPNYTISYTANADSRINAPTWVNLTLNDMEGARIGDINYFIDGVFNRTENGNGIHNLFFDLPANEPLTFYQITLEFLYANGTWFRNQTFQVTKYAFLTVTGENTFDSTLLNPYVRLNDAQTVQNLSIEFTLSETLNLTAVEFYGKYNFPYDCRNLLNITIRDSEFNIFLDSVPGSIVYGHLNHPDTLLDPFALLTPQWIQFEFNESILLPADSYYCQIDTAIPNGGGNTNYFDVYTTVADEDGSQQSLQYNNNLHIWSTLDRNLLFQFRTEKYTPSDLTEIGINATLLDNENQLTTTAFDAASSTVNFTQSEGGTWPVIASDLPISFTANYSCRFKFNYTVVMNWTEVSRSCSFEALFAEELVVWETWINATTPVVSESNIIFEPTSLHYTVQFPSIWYNFNGTAPTSNFTSSATTPSLYINASVARLNWTFHAMSPNIDVSIGTSDNREEYAVGMDINCSITYPALRYNTTLTFWNASFNAGGSHYGRNVDIADFLEYEVSRNRGFTNISYITVFPNYTLPEEYANTTITARVWWHNETAAGITIANFTIKQFSTLVNLTYVGGVSVGQNFTMQYQYQDINSDSITIANISTNWLEGNWSYQYISGVYYVEFTAYETAGWEPGTSHQVIVKFNHTDYIAQEHQFTIYIMLESQLTLGSASPGTILYMNATQTLWFRWYTVDNARVCYDQDDLVSLSMDIRFDGAAMGNLIAQSAYYFFDWEAEYPAQNLQIVIPTKYYGDEYFLGQHIATLELSKTNDTTKIAPQSYSYYFTIVATPTYLTYLTSSAAEVVGNAFFEYEQNQDPLVVLINYQCNATESETPNLVKYFKFGSIYGQLYDLSNNQKIGALIRFESLYNGTYIAEFPTFSLSTANFYEIRMFSNTTNFQSQNLIFSLTIRPRYSIIFEYEDILRITEQDPIVLDFNLYYDAAAGRMPYADKDVNITVIFFGRGQVFTESFLIRTNSSGGFYSSTVIAPNFDEFNKINITISVLESEINWANHVDLQIDVDLDYVQRVILPIAIVLASMLVGIPLFVKYGYPYLEKKIPFFRRNKKQLHLAEEQARQKAHPLETMTTLKVPKIYLQEDSVSKVKVTESVEYDVLEITPEKLKSETSLKSGSKLKDKVVKSIKDFQEIFGGTKIVQSDLAKKVERFQKAVLLESQKRYFDAAVFYSRTLYYAEKLGLKDEVRVLNISINRVQMKMSPKDQIVFLKEHFMKKPVFSDDVELYH